MKLNETILAILPGSNANERLVISMRDRAEATGQDVGNHVSKTGNDGQPTRTLRIDEFRPDRARTDRSDPSGAESLPGQRRSCCDQCRGTIDKPIVMRQETFSAAVGWFTQSCVEMTPEQWAMMRAATATTIPAATTMTVASQTCRSQARRAQTRRAASTATAGGSLRLLISDEAMPA